MSREQTLDDIRMKYKLFDDREEIVTSKEKVESALTEAYDAGAAELSRPEKKTVLYTDLNVRCQACGQNVIWRGESDDNPPWIEFVHKCPELSRPESIPQDLWDEMCKSAKMWHVLVETGHFCGNVQHVVSDVGHGPCKVCAELKGLREENERLLRIVFNEFYKDNQGNTWPGVCRVCKHYVPKPDQMPNSEYHLEGCPVVAALHRDGEGRSS